MSRKKTPDKIKKLKSTDQKVRLSGDENIGIDNYIELPQTPSWICTYGKRIYRSLGNTLIKLGMINEMNENTFYQYCNEVGNYIQLSEDLKKEGRSVLIQEESSKGEIYVTGAIMNPKVKIANEALKNSKTLAVEFGLTPASVIKIVGMLGGKKKDPFDNFLDDK